MTPEERQQVDNNIRKLDYLTGTGIISGQKKRLADELYVFISAGGSGRNALINLKKTMKNQVDDADVRRKTRFIAIDASWEEQGKAVKECDLEESEVIKLPYADAHRQINPSSILPQTKKWVHPDLWLSTGGKPADNNPPRELNGTGAGAKRQCGRLLFAQSAAQEEFYRKGIRAIVNMLGGAGERKIKIFFIAGIAGGTGSGTIIDLVYLTRHYLRQELGDEAYRRVQFYGYLLLPSACKQNAGDGPSAKVGGNRNAYAALKEIDYYMTISRREEHFRVNFGDLRIDNNEDIFNFCTLVEGVGAGGVFQENNVESAKGLIADSIMNIVCTDETHVANDENIFLVDAFHSNVPEQTNIRIAQHSYQNWPRNANYIYNVIGISSCIIPVDLLTAYVLNRVFEKMYSQFRRAEDVTDERTVEFLENCNLTVEKLAAGYNNTSPQTVIREIQLQTEAEFRAYGPYYVVNLTKRAAELIEEDEEYLRKARRKKNSQLSNPLGTKTAQWDDVITKYTKAAAYLVGENQKLYDVYTYVIDQLKNLIRSNAGLLTEAREYQNTFGKSYFWTPIDLRRGDNATKSVKDYLQGFVNDQALDNLVDKFIDNLCENKDKWTELVGHGGNERFDAAGELRSFIAQNLAGCVHTTLEQFLVMAYSGKSNVSITKLNDHNEETYSDDTKNAAIQLLERLSDNAQPLVSTSRGFLNQTYNNVYLTVPQECKWLIAAIKAECTNYMLPDNVYETTATDRIVLCKNYSGVPAWALEWTKKAEEDYESAAGGPKAVGIHIDQGSESPWFELPNLYPEGLWENDPEETRVRHREAEISADIRKQMDKAKELEMLRPIEKEPEYYEIIFCKENASASDLLEKAELKKNKKYELSEVLNILVEKKEATKEKVNYVNMVMNTTDDLNDEELKAFRYDLACQTMRILHEKWKPLKESIEVFTALKEILPEPPDYSKLTAFIDAILYEAIVFDDLRYFWMIKVGNEKLLGDKLGDKFIRMCAHYHGFKAFSELDVRELQKIVKFVSDKQNAPGNDDELRKVKEAKRALKKSLKALKDSQDKNDTPWPQGSPFEDGGNESPWPMASYDFQEKAGKNTDNIRQFYDELVKNL